MHIWEYGLPTAFNMVEINHQRADALPPLCNVRSAARVCRREIVEVSFVFTTHFVIQDLQTLAIFNRYVHDLGNAPVQLGDEGAVATAVVDHGMDAGLTVNNGGSLEFDARQANQLVASICAQHAVQYCYDGLSQTQGYANVAVVRLDHTGCSGCGRSFVAVYA